MSEHHPESGALAELPERITLTLPEVSLLLGALDRSAEVVEGEDLLVVVRATRLITRKVWSELGGLLDEEGE